ncbi:STAS domain-containing protein [Anaerophaga thermohalophila]|jgi:anti-sigma B factor antagonist|uniref:STAS domain-containing protein n=1 Tax=Anaerophaga thermohalophila TaxID=177400 RepID=UPI0002DB649D|nr:STAS domain-containing protein [Anaerophaga thermohalophila]
MDTRLKVTRQNNMLIGTLEDTDRLNATIAPEVKAQLNSNLNKTEVNFILNLQKIKFIDSTGIGVLISALKTARQNNGNFYLSNVNKEVMDLLSLMKLDKVFDFYEG